MAALTVFTGDTTPSASDLDANFNLLAAALGARNLLINGDMRVDQRNSGAALTITAGAALAYTVDRWYGYCTGANTTFQRVAGTAPEPFVMQYTGAAGVTAVGIGQRIEAASSRHLAGSTATLSVLLANSLLTTVTWAAYYATTTDAFGTRAAPTRTLIANGTFTVSATQTRYSAQIAIPAAATTGIEIVFSVGAQTSGTWRVGAVQLEAGSLATPFERVHVGHQLAMCQRYYYQPAISHARQQYGSAAGANLYTSIFFPVQMRAAPVVSAGWGGGINATASTIAADGPCSATAKLLSSAAGEFAATIVWTSFSAEL